MTAKNSTDRVHVWRTNNPERAKQNRQKARVAEQRYRDANRERLREYNRVYHREIRQPTINAEKLRRGACIDCGLAVTEDNLVVFDFDHRDPSAKLAGIGRVAPLKLPDEMAKCDLRCANCHRLKTWRQKDGRTTRTIPSIPDTLF